MPIAAAAIGAGISAAGGILANNQSANAAERNYKHRYQWQVRDLQKAGLNPMLAVSQGAPNVPQPTFTNVGEAAVKGGSAGFSAGQMARLQKEQIAAIQADIGLKGAQTAAAAASAQGVQLDNAIKAPIAANAASSAEVLLEKQHAEAASALHAAQVSGLDVVLRGREVEMGRLTIEQQQALQRVEIAYKSFLAEQARQGISAAKADAEFWDSAGQQGKWLQFLKQMVK